MTPFGIIDSGRYDMTCTWVCIYGVQADSMIRRPWEVKQHTVRKNERRRKIQEPGIKPGTSAVLKPRHNQLDHPCLI